PRPPRARPAGGRARAARTPSPRSGRRRAHHRPGLPRRRDPSGRVLTAVGRLAGAPEPPDESPGAAARSAEATRQAVGASEPSSRARLTGRHVHAAGQQRQTVIGPRPLAVLLHRQGGVGAAHDEDCARRAMKRSGAAANLAAQSSEQKWYSTPAW